MEQTTEHCLKTKGYETFVPTYQMTSSYKSIAVPLFPGYVFCRFDPNVRCPIVTTPGVLRVVGFGKKPALVCESEIEAIRKIVLSPLPARPHEYLAAGQTVRVKQGPLYGVEGKIATFQNANRLIVSVTLLERSVSVEIDSEWVEPVLITGEMQQ